MSKTTTSTNRNKSKRLLSFTRPNRRPIHLLIDSSGLKVHVGRLRKPPKYAQEYRKSRRGHCKSRCRDWRKLHLGVDEETGEVVACDLTRKSARDASRVPSLVRQID